MVIFENHRGKRRRDDSHTTRRIHEHCLCLKTWWRYFVPDLFELPSELPSLSNRRNFTRPDSRPCASAAIMHLPGSASPARNPGSIFSTPGEPPKGLPNTHPIASEWQRLASTDQHSPDFLPLLSSLTTGTAHRSTSKLRDESAKITLDALDEVDCPFFSVR